VGTLWSDSQCGTIPFFVDSMHLRLELDLLCIDDVTVVGGLRHVCCAVTRLLVVP